MPSGERLSVEEGDEGAGAAVRVTVIHRCPSACRPPSVRTTMPRGIRRICAASTRNCDVFRHRFPGDDRLSTTGRPMHGRAGRCASSEAQVDLVEVGTANARTVERFYQSERDRDLSLWVTFWHPDGRQTFPTLGEDATVSGIAQLQAVTRRSSRCDRPTASTPSWSHLRTPRWCSRGFTRLPWRPRIHPVVPVPLRRGRAGGQRSRRSSIGARSPEAGTETPVALPSPGRRPFVPADLASALCDQTTHAILDLARAKTPNNGVLDVAAPTTRSPTAFGSSEPLDDRVDARTAHRQWHRHHQSRPRPHAPGLRARLSTPGFERCSNLGAIRLQGFRASIGRGRPAEIIEIEPSFGVIVVLDFGAHSVRISIADLGQQIHAHEELPVRFCDGPSAVPEQGARPRPTGCSKPRDFRNATGSAWSASRAPWPPTREASSGPHHAGLGRIPHRRTVSGATRRPGAPRQRCQSQGAGEARAGGAPDH